MSTVKPGQLRLKHNPLLKDLWLYLNVNTEKGSVIPEALAMCTTAKQYALGTEGSSKNLHCESASKQKVVCHVSKPLVRWEQAEAGSQENCRQDVTEPGG